MSKSTILFGCSNMPSMIPSRGCSAHGWALNLALASVLAVGWRHAPVAAAETADPAPMSKTLLVLKLGTNEVPAVRSKFLEQPPTIILEFPGQRVIGSVPELATPSKGVIQAINARYEPRQNGSSGRMIQSLQIALSAPYAYHIRSDAGRVIVEIEHPASVGSASLEVGLRSGAILREIGRGGTGERFRAMQEALAELTPTPWTLSLAEESPSASLQPLEVAAPAITKNARQISKGQPASPRTRPPLFAPKRPAVPLSPIAGFLFACAMVMAASAGLWVLLQGESFNGLWKRGGASTGVARIPSGVLLVDQLVWRAFERQGYELVAERELAESPGGTLRVITKDGAKAGLLFAGNGPFFEKQTVTRFVQAMGEANVDEGFLVAAGSFTVPAQRIAKESRVTLIARDQLIELLSAGARSEYFTKQLEQQHARLEEAKETLQQYASELDTFRRQRNDASWQLGEERARSAKLEIEVDMLQQELRRHEAELKRWELDAAALRKQWDESQWYLGESQARAQSLEQQLSAMQGAAERAERAERERDEANWFLAEERTAKAAVDEKLATAQGSLEAAEQRLAALSETLDHLTLELNTLRAYGERRRASRIQIPDASVEVWDGSDDPIFSGSPRDMSQAGIGFESDGEIPPSIRIRLSLPGREPIESAAQVVWQRAQGEPSRFQSGCRFTELPADTRARLEELFAAAPS